MIVLKFQQKEVMLLAVFPLIKNKLVVCQRKNDSSRIWLVDCIIRITILLENLPGLIACQSYLGGLNWFEITPNEF